MKPGPHELERRVGHTQLDSHHLKRWRALREGRRLAVLLSELRIVGTPPT